MKTSRNVHLVDATMFYAKEGGGVSTYLAAKASCLAGYPNIRHTIAAPPIVARDDVPSVRFATVPSLCVPGTKSFRMPRSAAAAAKVLCALEPDIIEVGDPYQFACAALRAKRECNVPVVAYYHSDLPNLVRRRFGGMAERIARRYVSHIYSQFDLVLAPSRVMVRRLEELGIERVVHQPLGVNTEVFSPMRRTGRLRQQLGLPPETRLLCFAGRFAREKQLPLLLDAVRRLGAPYHLLLIGSGMEIAPTPGHTCLPFQRNSVALAGLIADCDMLVHGGDQETFGLVVLEAMACGIPVVGMAAGGVAELVDDDTGALVPSGCARVLAEAIHGMYERDLAQLGENARRKAVEQYDWRRAVGNLVTVYESLCASPHRNYEPELSYVAE